MVLNISYETLFDSKVLRIRFDEVAEFIKVYDRMRYLVLFDHEKYDAIYNRIRDLISQKGGITCIISHNYETSKLILMII